MENYLKKMHQLSIFDNQPLPEWKRSLMQEWLAETASLTAESSLRILIVLSQQPSETGSGVYVREIVKELQKLGHKPYLLASHYRPLSTVDLPFLPDNQIYTTIFDNGDNSEIAEISFPIPGMSLDMPYLHVPFRELSESMLEEYCTVWISKLEVLIQKIHPHIIHINHLWLMAGIARSAVPWMPIVATSHGSEYLLLQDTPAFAPAIIPGVQSLDAVMPISKDTAQDAVKVLGVYPDRIHIIGNGYNQDLFQIMHRERGEPVLQRILARFQDLPSWNKLVLYVGKFADYKGVPYLIRAAKIYSEANDCSVITFIVGEGSKKVRTHLENLVERLELRKRVLLPGKLPYQEVGPLMNMANVFVLPSIYEGFGLVLLESLACGLRSVAVDRGGPPFFVPKELRENGFATLVEPLRLLENQQPDADDEDRYVADLAAAISNQIVLQTSALERQFIADSVKDLTWTTRIKKTANVYFSAIQFRRRGIVKRGQ
jgi:glycosyltransferase involved in cell wall biosynthesis